MKFQVILCFVFLGLLLVGYYSYGKKDAIVEEVTGLRGSSEARKSKNLEKSKAAKKEEKEDKADDNDDEMIEVEVEVEEEIPEEALSDRATKLPAEEVVKKNT